MHLLPLGHGRPVAAARKSWHDTIGLWILHSCSVVFLHSCLWLFPYLIIRLMTCTCKGALFDMTWDQVGWEFL